MIHSFLVVNNLGKVRLGRFYAGQGRARQQAEAREAFARVRGRPAGACNFVDAEEAFGPGTRLVYRQFATLFFVVVCDAAESDLGMLDLIQVYVEALDQVFENVCELNLIFSQPKAMQLLDEFILNGCITVLDPLRVWMGTGYGREPALPAPVRQGRRTVHTPARRCCSSSRPTNSRCPF